VTHEVNRCPYTGNFFRIRNYLQPTTSFEVQIGQDRHQLLFSIGHEIRNGTDSRVSQYSVHLGNDHRGSKFGGQARKELIQEVQVLIKEKVVNIADKSVSA
jgi:hypothetical protein